MLDLHFLRFRLHQRAVWLNSMLKTVKLPARIAHLDASLAQMDRNALPLQNLGQRLKYETHKLDLSLDQIFSIHSSSLKKIQTVQTFTLIKIIYFRFR